MLNPNEPTIIATPLLARLRGIVEKFVPREHVTNVIIDKIISDGNVIFGNQTDNRGSFGLSQLPQSLLSASSIPTVHSSVSINSAPAAACKQKVTSESRNSNRSKEETWVGREDIVDKLRFKLIEDCRLLILTGLTGIGKTRLADHLKMSIAEADNSLFQEICSIDRPKDFSGSVIEILRKLNEDVSADKSSSEEQLGKRLLAKLECTPCWLQIDTYENLLQLNANGWFHHKDQASPWVDFFRDFLNSSNCSSRIIITSQVLAADLEQAFGGYENFYREPLMGLEVSARLNFFRKRGLKDRNEAEANYLRRIAQYYEGHALVLGVIAGDILAKPYFGDIERYWQHHQEDYKQTSLSGSEPNLRASEDLKRVVIGKIENTLKHLSPEAFDLLCRSSVFRQAVPDSFWLTMLGDDLTGSQKEAALSTLKSHYLIEEEASPSQILFRQHSLIRNVSYKLLKADDRESSERAAAHTWLTNYNSTLETSLLERKCGFIEAIYHFCQIEDWENAKKILFTYPDTPIEKQLYTLLDVSGCYHELIQLCEKFSDKLRKVDPYTEITRLRSLGTAYYSIGNRPKAVEYQQSSLSLAQENGDRSSEAKALSNLGIVYHTESNYEDAIRYYQESLQILQEIGDHECEGKVIGNLGSICCALGEYDLAIQFFGKNLENSQELSNSRGEGSALSNLGIAQNAQGHFSDALKNWQSALDIFRASGNRVNEATVLKNLADLYCKLEDTEQAQEYCTMALAIATELNIPLVRQCEDLNKVLQLKGKA